MFTVDAPGAVSYRAAEIHCKYENDAFSYLRRKFTVNMKTTRFNIYRGRPGAVSYRAAEIHRKYENVWVVG